jgi:hypothetical protein
VSTKSGQVHRIDSIELAGVFGLSAPDPEFIWSELAGKWGVKCAGLTDATYHTIPIKLGKRVFCSNITEDEKTLGVRDSVVSVTDAVYISNRIKAGVTCQSKVSYPE